MTPEARIAQTVLEIANKDGEDVPFLLNSAQRMLDEALTGRDLVPKARQEGVSAYFLARNLIKCVGRRNRRAVIISHDQESTARMLKRVRYFIEHWKGPKPVIQNYSASEITFPKTDSMLYIGTAGSRRFGRGDTITDLHCSEYAYWPNPAELLKGLFQAVPESGEISIESTGNGFNDYYRRCLRAYEGKSRWTLHFLPWHTFDEYKLNLTSSELEHFMKRLDPELDEIELSKVLAPERLAWRRMKLEDLDFDISSFRQEYPMTFDECFQASSESIFHRVNYRISERWKKIGKGSWALEDHPNPQLHYVLGADVSAGVGKDSSVIEILCIETGEQVFEYTTNRTDPEAFGSKILEINASWCSPFNVIEQNNHGILTVATVAKDYPSGLIYQIPGSGDTEETQLMQLGYKTTARTKPLMIGAIRTALANNSLTIYSPLLNTELSTFIEDEAGRLGAQDGCHDDAVVALACAWRGFNEGAMRVRASEAARMRIKASVDPFSFDNVIEALRSKGRQWPIDGRRMLLTETIN